MGYLIDLGAGILGSLFAAEIWSHADPLSRWLIRSALQRLPEEQRLRREEEWLAHLEETPGAIRKLLHGFGCLLGAPAVGRTLAAPVRKDGRSTFGEVRVVLTVLGSVHRKQSFWLGMLALLTIGVVLNYRPAAKGALVLGRAIQRTVSLMLGV
jgi:hypothetical protein